MRQRNLSRLRIPAASGQRSCRTGMMRTPERPAADERVFLRQKSGNTVYFRQFQAFSITQKRHDTRYPLCSHGLACSRRTDHQKIMKTAHSNFHRPSEAFLSPDITEIRHIFCRPGFRENLLVPICIRFPKITDHFFQITYPDHFNIRYKQGFLKISRRYHTEPAFLFSCFYYHRKDSLNRMYLSIQAEFPGEHGSSQKIRVDDARRRKYGSCHRHIKTSPFFFYISGSKIHRDPFGRKQYLIVPQCSPHPVLGFLYLGRRKSNHSKRRQPAADISLHLDRINLHPQDHGR